MQINRRYIVDEQGNLKEVVIPIEDFRVIEDLLGWIWMRRLSASSGKPASDRDSGNEDAYVELDSI